MTSANLPAKCPSCSHALYISEVHCSHCQTTLRGRFSLRPFMDLTPEQRDFMLVFVRCRGNIKEVEKHLKISYPTVRRRLEDVIVALESASTLTTDEILASIEQGALSVDEALVLMNRGTHTSQSPGNPENDHD